MLQPLKSLQTLTYASLATLPFLLASCGGGGSGCSGSGCPDSPTKIATLSVTAGQSVVVDEVKYLAFTAKDSSGNTLSVPANNITWRTTSGGAYLTVLDTGQVRGVATGTASVTASANGVTSPATAVNVATSSAACTSTTYTPNYYTAINTPGTPNVSGNFRYWARTPLRIRFVRDSGWSQTLEDQFRAGMSQWQTATNNGIAFLETTSASAFDIEVSFVKASTLPGSAIGITYASYDADTLEMQTARISVANDLPTLNQELTTCSHELGHALGIGGHSPNDGDLMYYAENGTTTTTVRDLNTLRTVYCNSFPITRSPSKRPARIVTEAIY